MNPQPHGAGTETTMNDELVIPDDLLEWHRSLLNERNGTGIRGRITAEDVIPLIERIARLDQRLKTVLDREAESQRRHDAKVDKLEQQLANARRALEDVRATLTNYKHNKRGVLVRCEADCNCDRCCSRILCDRALISKEQP